MYCLKQKVNFIALDTNFHTRKPKTTGFPVSPYYLCIPTRLATMKGQLVGLCLQITCPLCLTLSVFREDCQIPGIWPGICLGRSITYDQTGSSGSNSYSGLIPNPLNNGVPQVRLVAFRAGFCLSVSTRTFVSGFDEGIKDVDVSFMMSDGGWYSPVLPMPRHSSRMVMQLSPDRTA